MDEKSFRFLAVSNVHSDLDLVRRIEEEVDFSKIDFVLFGGDLSDGRDDFRKLLAPFLKRELSVFMVPGNHETKVGVERLKDFYGVRLLGNSPIILGDNKVGIFGTNYLEIGLSGQEPGLIFENMVKNFEAVKECEFKIQMNHMPPEETEIGDASPFDFVGGSEPLKFFLDLEEFCPDVCFVGHIHESSGLEEIVNKTRVINLANDFRVFEFDLERMKLREIGDGK